MRVEVPTSHGAERAYVLRLVIERWLGQELEISSSPAATGTTITMLDHPGRIVLEDAVFGLADLSDVVTLENQTEAGWCDVGAVADNAVTIAKQLPVLYGPIPEYAVTMSARVAKVHVDIFGTVFALLSGLEDRWLSERDEYGRVPMDEALLARRGLVEHPVVDELVAVLWAIEERIWPGLKRPVRHSKCVPTHDVDRFSKYGQKTVFDIATAAAASTRREGALAAVRTAIEGFAVRAGKRTDPYSDFDLIMDKSESAGVTSSFYFIPRHAPADGTRLTRYQLTEPGLRSVFRRIAARGHTIGIHPGYDSHEHLINLKQDVRALRNAAQESGVEIGELGGRHHYLRWDSQTSPAAWQAADLDFDSSVSFAEAPGFRSGTSKPYPLWDAVNRWTSSVEERPLVWMDASDLVSEELKLGSETVLERAARLRQRCRLYGGDFTFLVHPDRYATSLVPDIAQQFYGL